MHILVRCCIYLSLIFAALPARSAVDIAGIHVDQSYRLSNQLLVLNGAGTRSKFFIKVYVGALYLGAPTTEAEQALKSSGPKSMQMIMLYKKVEAEKIAEGWSDGFKANLSPDELSALAARLKQFNSLFPDLRKGDHVYMDFTPGKGTTLKINNESRGQIEGADFFNALLRVWIGNHPADKGLKRGLLGE